MHDHDDKTPPVRLEELETRDTPAALSLPHPVAAVHPPTVQVAAAAPAPVFQVIDTLERRARGIKISAVPQGNPPGQQVRLQANLTSAGGGGLSKPEKYDKTITFTVYDNNNRVVYTTTRNTDESGHAEFRYTIPRGARIGDRMHYTVQYQGQTASANINVRR